MLMIKASAYITHRDIRFTIVGIVTSLFVCRLVFVSRWRLGRINLFDPYRELVIDHNDFSVSHGNALRDQLDWSTDRSV